MRYPKPSTETVDRFVNVFGWHEHQIFKEFYMCKHRERLLNRIELEFVEGRILSFFFVDRIYGTGVIDHRAVDLYTAYVMELDGENVLFEGYDIYGALFTLNGLKPSPVTIWVLRDVESDKPFLGFGNERGLVLFPSRNGEKRVEGLKRGLFTMLMDASNSDLYELGIDDGVVDEWARELGIVS